MTRFKLLLRNLTYFRAANLAVIAGMAVATAVLTGALMVGDSVRGSLRELALARMGWVDQAMIAPRMTPASLADRLSKSSGAEIVPGLILRGGAAIENNPSRVPGVQIIALKGTHQLPRGKALMNHELARQLGIESTSASVPAKPRDSSLGPQLRFSLPTADDAPRDATLARRGRADTIATLEVTSFDIAPAGSFHDLFDLTGGQRAAPRAWLSFDDLQDALELDQRANLFLASAKPDLNTALKEVLSLADLGLETTRSKDKSETVLASASTFVHPALVTAAEKLAADQKLPLRKVSVYLINKVSRDTTQDSALSTQDSALRTQHSLHYAIAAGISDLGLSDDQVTVNQWTADQLKLKTGDRLTLAFYRRQPNGDLTEVTAGKSFTVSQILPMTGLGADPSLTPTYKGLTDADTIADWNPPAGLTINKKLVTKDDETYWGTHKAAPKLFLSMNSARALWGNAYGDVTSLRIPSDKSDSFTKSLLKEIDPRQLGLHFRPVKAEQLAASSGSTDFAGLFIGFSFFLLIAAILLVAMLFRLSVEQRARQLGLLAASGFAPSQLRNLCLKEGLILAILGAAIGLGAGIGYTALIIHGLRTWWYGAIGTTALRLFIEPRTLTIGLAASVIVALLAIAWAVRRISKTQPSQLLAGALGASRSRLAKPPRFSIGLAVVATLAAVALFVAGAMGRLKPEAAFLGGGATLLLAALLAVFVLLRPSHHLATGVSLAGLAIRNATRNRTRSLLCIALIALASFTIVTVSSMESATPANTFEKQSGAGGFALIVQTDIPLLGDLNTLPGRQLLMRQSAAKDPRWEKAKFAMLRKWAGQDISCLNITRPDSPTLLAAPLDALQGRFTFASTLTKTDNPWSLLDQPQDDDNTIPVIADSESAQYILHLKLGQTLPITDAAGRPRNLKLVATLSGSIFQSEMLLSVANFQRLFPAQAGFQTVLVDTSPIDAPEISKLLQETLNDTTGQEKSDYSATIQTTADRLHRYHEVANTYLSTFQVLGSLGLMLGTIGLAVVLVRNLIERRSELALLSALGFAPARRSRLVFLENSTLLILGLAIGAGCALAGVIPNVLTSPRRINAPALSIALGAVLLIGMLSLLIAVRLSVRKVTPAALRAQ